MSQDHTMRRGDVKMAHHKGGGVLKVRVLHNKTCDIIILRI